MTKPTLLDSDHFPGSLDSFTVALMTDLELRGIDVPMVFKSLALDFFLLAYVISIAPRPGVVDK